MQALDRSTAWTRLWAGLTTTSLASCVGAVLVALGEFVFCCFFITQRRIATIDPHIMMENLRDDYARITINALRLRYVPDPGLSVAYIGASAARQALLHSESPGLIQDYLTSQVGVPVRFHFLCADAESLRDAVVLSDQVPSNFHGVVVMVISDYRDEDREYGFRIHDKLFRPGARLALYSDTDDALAVDLGEVPRTRTGNYFLDEFTFFAVRRVAGARIFRAEQKPPIEGGAPHFTNPAQLMAFQRRMAQNWEKVRRDYASHSPLAITTKDAPILETLVDGWKARGIKGILLEAPDNPKYDEIKGAFRKEYEHEIVEFAERVGVTYWNLNPEVQLKPTDFADHVHLIDRGARFKFQAAFLRQLAVVLKEQRAAAEAQRDE